MIVIAGHPAADATVPEAALGKKGMAEIASWFQSGSADGP